VHLITIYRSGVMRSCSRAFTKERHDALLDNRKRLETKSIRNASTIGSTFVARRAWNENRPERGPNEEQVTPPKVNGSVAVTPKSSDSTATRQGQRNRHPNRHTDKNGAHSLAQNHPQNVAGARAESDADADFRVRRLTEYAITPNTPAVARSSATIRRSDEMTLNLRESNESGIDLRKRPELPPEISGLRSCRIPHAAK